MWHSLSPAFFFRPFLPTSREHSHSHKGDVSSPFPHCVLQRRPFVSLPLPSSSSISSFTFSPLPRPLRRRRMMMIYEIQFRWGEAEPPLCTLNIPKRNETIFQNVPDYVFLTFSPFLYASHSSKSPLPSLHKSCASDFSFSPSPILNFDSVLKILGVLNCTS